MTSFYGRSRRKREQRKAQQRKIKLVKIKAKNFFEFIWMKTAYINYGIMKMGKESGFKLTDEKKNDLNIVVCSP